MKILVVAEQRDGKIKKAGYEAVRAGRILAEASGGEVVALVIGSSVKDGAASTGNYGAHRALAAEHPRLSSYSTTAFTKIVTEAAKQVGATAVLIPATSQGKDYAPRVAIRLEAGLAADCTSLRIDGGNIVATRPVYAGKASTEVRVTTATQVFTLRPNVFTAGQPSDASAAVGVLNVTLEEEDFRSVVTDVKQSSGKLDVAEADIIVTGGRGLKGPESFAMIEELASVLGGAVGASRAVVDAGWRPHDEQVGQTGKTVSPSLYVAVAVSGAIQHLAGMSSSKYIVAINKDKEAPIFQVADYGIVGDAFEIIPAFTKAAKQLLGK